MTTPFSVSQAIFSPVFPASHAPLSSLLMRSQSNFAADLDASQAAFSAA